MVTLQRELREQLKHLEPSPSQRTAILWKVLSDPEVWESLKKDPALVRELVKKRYLHE
jgi:hypothetical protein